MYDAGQIICLSSLTDITELVFPQQAMRESERRFRELFEHQGIDVLEPNHLATAHAAEIINETEQVTLLVRNLLGFARQEPQVHS